MKKCNKCGRTEEHVIISGKTCNICKADAELLKKYGYTPPKLIPAGLQMYNER